MNHAVVPMLGNHVKIAKEGPFFSFLHNEQIHQEDESFIQLFTQVLEQNGLFEPYEEMADSISDWTKEDLDHLQSIILSVADEKQLQDVGIEQLVHALVHPFLLEEGLNENLRLHKQISSLEGTREITAEALAFEPPKLQAQSTEPSRLVEFIGFIIEDQLQAYLRGMPESPLRLNEEQTMDWSIRLTKAIEDWKAVSDPQTSMRMMMAIKEQPLFLEQVDQKIRMMLQNLVKPDLVFDSEMDAQTAFHKEAVEFPLTRSWFIPANYNSMREQAEHHTVGMKVEQQGMPVVYAPVAQAPPMDANLRVTHQHHTNFTQAQAEVRVTAFVEQMTPFLIKQMTITQLQGTSEAKIRLIPEHLGQLDIKISITNGQLTALINSDNTAAKEMLELQLPMLRQALQTQGLQVERLEITHQANQNLGGQQGQGQHSHHQPGSSHSYASQQGQVAESYEAFEEWPDEMEAEGHDLMDPSELTGQMKRSFEATA